MLPILHLGNVVKVFPSPTGPHTVLKNISLEVFPGEVVAVLGPSGSGKSTMLRTVNALEAIDSGTIEVCGLKYNASKIPLHEIRRRTAMIFQRFELFPHYSALENVALPLRCVLNKPRNQAYAEAMTYLERVGLKDHAYKYPKNLSGGQQQRVAIARALALSPQLLLCDEPTSSLDPELVGEVLSLLADIARSGMTMIIVTHEVRFARKISTRCLFLDDGELVESGPTKEFFENPKSPRLKEFLSKVVH